MRPIQHEITLLAWATDMDGKTSILDIVETSYHHAYRFARAWVRPGCEVTHISAFRPGTPIETVERRAIRREAMQRYVNVHQDGADFYGTPVGNDWARHIWTAPFKVHDFDMPAAERARAAFIAWCAEQGIAIEWEKLS